MNNDSFKSFCDSIYDDWFFKVHTTNDFSWEEKASKSMLSLFSIDSILDLGCGVGRWLKAAEEFGCSDVCGLEYCFERAKPYFYQNVVNMISFGDVSIPFSLNKQFDCVLSVEVAEHILPQNSSTFVENIINHCKKIVVFTAAPPGQAGHGHLNTHTKKFWRDLFEKNGAIVNNEKYNELLKTWEQIVPQYIKNNLMIFEKR